MSGIKQFLKRDGTLREMVKTPLFLTIILMAHRGKKDVDTMTSQDERTQRKYLFNTYTTFLFERIQSRDPLFKQNNVLHWITWLANRMQANSCVVYYLEKMQPEWLESKKNLTNYKLTAGIAGGLTYGFGAWLFLALVLLPRYELYELTILKQWISNIWPDFLEINIQLISPLLTLSHKLSSILVIPLFGWMLSIGDIQTVDSVVWQRNKAAKGFLYGLISGWFGVLLMTISYPLMASVKKDLEFWELLVSGLTMALFYGVVAWFINGFVVETVDQPKKPGELILSSTRNFIRLALTIAFSFCLISMLIFAVGFLVGGTSAWQSFKPIDSLLVSLFIGVYIGMFFGGFTPIKFFSLLYVISKNNYLPWKLIPFLDYCCDLIFLRRVGGGYIFIHRLLMEHFAEMYTEKYAPKESQ